MKRVRCLCWECCSGTLANCNWRQSCRIKWAGVVWITDLTLTNLALKEHSMKCAQAIFFILMPIFYTREQSNPENHGNICALTPGDALKLRGTCRFLVSGSSGVLVLQGKTTEFPKTVLFLGVMRLSFCFCSCQLKTLNLENFTGRMRSLRGHYVWSDHDETINLNNSFLSQSCEIS